MPINTVKYVSHYKVARIVVALMSFLGWIVCIISIGIAVKAAMSSSNYGYEFALFASVPGLIGALGGLLMVAMGQLTRATLDSADYSGEMLSIMKKVHESKDTYE